VSDRDRRAELLAAWKDGELRGLAARRAARLLERSPEARHELEALGAVGGWVREVEASGARPEVDLWAALAPRLAAVDAERGEAETPHGWLQRPWAASVALAAAAVALVVGLLIQPAPRGDDVVQWLDSEGAPVMVLDGPDTVIWVLHPDDEEISNSGGRVAA
jgi:hypothetical protein